MVTVMVMNDLLPPPLFNVNRPSYSDITAIHGQRNVCGQRSMSHLRPWVQSICLLFVSWQSDHFWLRYSKLYIWPWKFKVKVMAKVEPDDHIWCLEFNRFCFSFRGNRTMFFIFYLFFFISNIFIQSKIPSVQKLLFHGALSHNHYIHTHSHTHTHSFTWHLHTLRSWGKFVRWIL